MFANFLVWRLQFHHGSTESGEVGCTQRVVVVVQILTVHATRSRQQNCEQSIVLNSSDSLLIQNHLIKVRLVIYKQLQDVKGVHTSEKSPFYTTSYSQITLCRSCPINSIHKPKLLVIKAYSSYAFK